ncbi:MAG: hypothetical protein HQL29_05015 [Candidatus Omnitrophica bacterium]|nr:hypothetical protein [Candidatus Omnitrophota bacterium]
MIDKNEGIEEIKKNHKPGTWYSEAAFILGKASKKISTKVGTAANKVTANFDGVKVIEDPRSSILRDVKGILDVSGLSFAISEMNEISIAQSKHPVITRLISKIEDLPSEEQEVLSRKFIDRLSKNSNFMNATHLQPAQMNFSEDECQKLLDSFIDCFVLTMRDVGMGDFDGDLLRQLSGEITRPLNDLMQLYLNPKTFSQKTKRLWRMQRIFFKTISLIMKTNALALEPSCQTITIDPS